MAGAIYFILTAFMTLSQAQGQGHVLSTPGNALEKQMSEEDGGSLVNTTEEAETLPGLDDAARNDTLDLDVTKMNVTLGMTMLRHNIRFCDVRDVDDVFRLGIKYSYDDGCDSKEAFKKNTFRCLKTHDLLLSNPQTGCKVVVTGRQWAETYRLLFRDFLLLLRRDAHFLSVGTCGGRVAMTDFFVIPRSKESSFKFLPYELDHFGHMLKFSLSAHDISSRTETVRFEVHDACLPDLSQLTSPNATSTNCSDGQDVFREFANLYENPLKGGVSFIRKTTVTPDNTGHRDSSYNGQQVSGADGEGIDISASGGCHVDAKDGHIRCSAGRHLTRSQRHLYMIALYVQVYYIAEYLDESPHDLEVCIVDGGTSGMYSRRGGGGGGGGARRSPSGTAGQADPMPATPRWFYSKLRASSTSRTERFTLIECCSMTKKLKVYYDPLEDNQMNWECHDPYVVANTILLCVNIGSYISVLFLPLCVRFLPPFRVGDHHEGCSKIRRKSSKLSRDKESRPSRKTSFESDTTAPVMSPTTPDMPTTAKTKQAKHRSSLKVRDLDGQSDQMPPGGGKEAKSALLAPPSVRITDDSGAENEEPLYIPPHDLLFLDSDPVYSFGLKTLVSHLLLFHIESRVLIVGRRFLTLYALWVLVHLASFIVAFYYPPLAAHYQAFSYPPMDLGKDASGEEFWRVFYLLVLAVPLCYATPHFLLLSPLLTRMQPVCKLLSWDANERHLGSMLSFDPKYIFYKRSKPCEASFYMLLASRLKLLACRRFWGFLFKEAIVKLPTSLRNPPADSGGTAAAGAAKPCDHHHHHHQRHRARPLRNILLAFIYVLKLPLVLVVSVVYTLPFFVIHRELVVNPQKFVRGGDRKTKAVVRSSWRRSVASACVATMALASMLLTFILLLSFCFLYGSMAIFVLVDVIRNIRTNVNHGVLFISVLLYVQNALVGLEDDYRRMKATVFQVCRALDDADLRPPEEQAPPPPPEHLPPAPRYHPPPSPRSPSVGVLPPVPGLSPSPSFSFHPGPSVPGSPASSGSLERVSMSAAAAAGAAGGPLRSSRPPLIWTSPDGETAIPRRIFTGVCDCLMPYSTEIVQTSLSLVFNLSLVFFLYVLVIDFQALDQFTGIGQSLMTIFTVSLPGLIGKLRSEAACELNRERMYTKVMATVRQVVSMEDVFAACPSQAQLNLRRLSADLAMSSDHQKPPHWV